MEDVAVFIGATRFNGDFQMCFLFHHFLSVALLAFILFGNADALAHTFRARLGGLLVHTRSQHLHFGDHTLTLARSTFLHVGAALAVATLTTFLASVVELHHLAFVDIFKADLEILGDALAFFGTSVGASAAAAAHSEHVEDVSESAAGASTSTALLDTGHAVLVIKCALIFIAQNFIGFTNFFELNN